MPIIPFDIQPVTTTADLYTVVSLAARIWQPTYGGILSAAQLNYMFDRTYSLAALEEVQASGQAFYLLKEAGEAIGFASWSMWQTPAVPKLNKLYVLPSLHRRGAGRWLLQQIEAMVAEKGYERLQLCVNIDNPAHTFYERCGYTVIRREDFPFDHFWMNDYVMERVLRS